LDIVKGARWKRRKKKLVDQILIFSSALLGTLGDALIYSFQFFFRVRKHYVFGKKILDKENIG